MENNFENIDKKFSEASDASDEKLTTQEFEKVWDKIENKLDKIESKKRIIPMWFPYGIAASLIIGLGIFLFNDHQSKKDDNSKIVVNKTLPTKSEIVNPKIKEIDDEIKSNIEKEIAPKRPEVIAMQVPSLPIQNSYKPAFENDKIIGKDVFKKNQWKDTLKKNEIESVVIMGYSKTDKKVAMTSSSSIVSSSEIRNKTSSGFLNSLQGEAAGLAIYSGSGVPGSAKQDVIIRGLSSINSSNEPLYVVNGEIINSRKLKKLDPNKIKDIRILKDASVTSLYGTRGKNGVILIQTKKLSRKEKRRLHELMKDVKLKEEVIAEEKSPQAGLLTAGEVNDFSKWDYWKDIAAPTLNSYKETWKFFPDRRVSVQLIDRNKNPIIGEKLKLLNDKKEIIWEAVSNNLGNAELWINPLTENISISEKYILTDEKGKVLSSDAKEFKNGQNIVILNKTCVEKQDIELSFVVDATGSMGDEINYLKSELLDVLKKVENNLQNVNVRYSSVFYRDQGDEYVTRKFDFTNKAEDLINFIKDQNASGGGDTPEAVVEALQVSIDELSWSKEKSTKIIFLILDAPPHQSDENSRKVFEKIKLAAKKGITIIPLAASDTDKETEYLMRTFALFTNGTYTFLTNDSGIGNNHIEPTIDSFEVEKLNDLLLRLILQRSVLPKCNRPTENSYLNKKLEKEASVSVDSTITIYPNPTKGIVNVKSKNNIDELIIYDLAGKILMRKENLKENQTTVDLLAYPQSTYLMRIRTTDHWETFKIIKN